MPGSRVPVRAGEEGLLERRMYEEALSGQQETRKVLQELHGQIKERSVSPYHVAMIQAELGEQDLDPRRMTRSPTELPRAGAWFERDG